MSIESLLVKQAKLSDRRRELKAEGCKEAAKCTRLKTRFMGDFEFNEGKNCISEAYSCWKDDCEEAALNHCSGPHFDEVWQISVDEDEVCRHCQRVRELKKQRMQVGRELAGVRAAITRIGRRLAREQAA